MIVLIILCLFTIFLSLLFWATHNAGHNYNSDGGDF